MTFKSLLPAGLLVVCGLAACQTAPNANSGFLSAYDRLEAQEGTVRASIRQHRDETRASGIEQVWLEPTVLIGSVGGSLTDEDRALVLREVDRQVCYEISERFTLTASPEGAARVRTAVVRIDRTGPAGSAVAAVATAFIPGPGTVRVPGTTGGLAAEAELLDAVGRQAAAIAWARNANVLGTDSPSLSRVGDALQMAEPFADAVGDAFAPADRPVRPIAEPDPCGRFGPRNQPGGFLTRLVTGLYVPEVNTGTREDAPAEAPRP
ncbi:MAG: DUF3313 family protein [Brevundimonas sp.]|uniref:DUF3313 family protein n=1 Tax=Brevundimonas sp. TaxID=1871086 RepID=UPI00271C6782|nr:DUF3313 family protein [Brevundimonas sp.]MDO9078311.1 DUF3313 family protein [Brevundimonas sp.]